MVNGVPQGVGDDGSVNSQTVVSVAPDGKFLLVWVADTFSVNHQTVHGRLFDRHGVALREAFRPFHPEGVGFGDFFASGLSDGRFLLSWVASKGTGIDSIYVYEVSDGRLSRPLIVRGIFDVGFFVAVNTVGQGIVTWTANDQKTGDLSGRVSLFDIGK